MIEQGKKKKYEKGQMDLKRISYFSDFILMQQLMTIEIDVLVGRTNNFMKYLDLQHDNEARVDKDKPAKHESISKSFKIDAGIDLHTVESNMDKIKAIEARMDHFIEVFSKSDSGEQVLNETW